MPPDPDGDADSDVDADSDTDTDTDGDTDTDSDSDADTDGDADDCWAWGGCSDGRTCCVVDVNGDAPCVDLSSDDSNCGECGNACWPGTSCVEGECEELVCDWDRCAGQGGQEGLVCCETREGEARCTDIANDPDNCGWCGRACGEGVGCVRGECSCKDGPVGSAIMCGDECVDTMTNPSHCGGCGNECDEGELCVQGFCFGAECPVDCWETRSCCATEDGDLDCVDLASDPQNCGECGRVCAELGSCVQGDCGQGDVPGG